MIKPLIFIPSPRDISEFTEATKKLKHDKLWVKYHQQQHAYDLARLYFLTNYDHYTHFIILPDDLIIKWWHLDILLSRPDDVISGWCANTARVQGFDNLDSCVSFSLPPDPPCSGIYSMYNFLLVEDIQSFLDTGTSIMPVKFSGFAPMIIPRKIIEQIPFRTSDGCCVDSCFSIDLAEHGIKQYVDLQCQTQHIRHPAILVGQQEPYINFERTN